jgi:hypothetical protein
MMGNLKRLEDTLVSVLENQPERSEVVVVLNGPYDDPYDLRGEVTFVEAPRGADLVGCFACGLAASSAPIVHVLASGFEAMPSWADAALARFDDATVAAVAPMVVDRDDPDHILSAGLSYSPGGRLGRIGAGKRLNGYLAADRRSAAASTLFCGPEMTFAFYRRQALETVETIPHLGNLQAVGVDLALSIQKAGYRVVQESSCLATATRDLLDSGSAWGEGAANERLFRRWRALPGGQRSWAAHGLLLAMECLQFPFRPSNLGRLAGRCWTMLGLGAPSAVALGTRMVSRPSEAVIRPAHFASAEARTALQSRAAG